MGAEISVKLSADVAAQLKGRAAESGSADELRELTSRLEIELRPVHPSIGDGELASYYVAEAPDRESAERIAARLRECGSVEGAYYVPGAEPPSPDDTEPP